MRDGSDTVLKSAVASMDDVEELYEELSDGGETKYFGHYSNFTL